jgi:methionyl-tRNA formyltransferase
LRALFFGSPAFAVPSLDALCSVADVVAVVCQPDRPSGRGLALAAPPVKDRALALGLPVAQPTKLRTGEFGRWVLEQRADVALVVAYGRILPGDALSAPRCGCVNVHASLLPKYRGAAPIVWAIAHGERETGITLMKLDLGMDTGPTFACTATDIGPDETAAELSARLAVLGAQLVQRWLPAYVAGQCILEPQDDAAATLAPLLEKEHGRIDWSKPAIAIHDHVRAMTPWPGAFTILRTRTLKVHATRVRDAAPAGQAGEVLIADKTCVLVICGTGCLELTMIQPEGKRAMPAHEWVAGRGIAKGDVLGRS